jgi:nucleoid DNA-binding protein/cell division septation protein DedD
MENYILSLIKENNRVIVPNFGAFIVAKENGFSVLFNNFLSFNDGLLVDYITDKESISREEAEGKIEEYVQKLKQELDNSGSYTINGLGTFKKDTTGILRFEQSDELSEETSAPESTSEVKSSDDLLDIDNNSGTEKDDSQESVESSYAASSLNDTTPIAEFEDETEPAKEEEQSSTVGKKIFEPESELNDSEEKEQDPIAIANKYLEEDNSKRNRSIVIFLSLFILLPLIGFSIYFFLIKGNSPAKTQKQITEVQKPEKVELEPAAGVIEAGPDTAQQEAEEAIVEPEPVTTPEPMVNKPHQLIVGSFSSEINADKMIQKLKAKGYEQSFWFMHNDRYLVSLESFAKVYEAQARQEEILNSERMESWIITKRK